MMDASTFQAGLTGLKYAIDAVRTMTGTAARNQAEFKVAEILEHLGKAQETLFDLRSTNQELQLENQDLKAKLRVRDSWGAIEAKYSLVQAPGGAMVMRTEDTPAHYACPRCFGDHKRSILQDRRVAAGTYDCPECKADFNVESPRQMRAPRLF